MQPSKIVGICTVACGRYTGFVAKLYVQVARKRDGKLIWVCDSEVPATFCWSKAKCKRIAEAVCDCPVLLGGQHNTEV